MSSGASKLRKRLWDLERFGLDPHGISMRIKGSPAPKLISNSIPKAGTHLVERILCLHPDIHRKLTRTVTEHEGDRLRRLSARQRPGELLCSHITHDAETASVVSKDGAKLVFVIRDPRDIVVSRAHFASSQPDHWLHETVRQLPDTRARMLAFIEGGAAGEQPRPISWWLERYSGWLTDSDVVVRFEDLVDPERCVETLTMLFEGLGVQTDTDLTQAIADRAVSPVSTTFRKGTAGQWQSAFDDDLIERFNAVAAEWLPLYGYEI